MKQNDAEQLLRSAMYRYIPKELADELLSSTDDHRRGGMPKEVSILFTHVFNYNFLAEGLSVQVLHALLNELFEYLVDDVFRYQGIVDKYIGADLMAVYGSTAPLEHHAWRAVQSALSMHRALQEFNATRILRNQLTLDVGIGINSGVVIPGNIGSSKRMEFTVIGHEVNVARYVSQLDHYPGYRILMGEKTYHMCAGRFQARLVDTFRLNLQGESVKVYGLAEDEMLMFNNLTALEQQ